MIQELIELLTAFFLQHLLIPRYISTISSEYITTAIDKFRLYNFRLKNESCHERELLDSFYVSRGHTLGIYRL